MKKEKKPLFSDEFLDALIEEINQLYSSPVSDLNEELAMDEQDQS
jgi:hypothetical protein